MRLIRSADYQRKPWKNGGGLLADILTAPEGAGLNTFDWRLSAAHVGRDGPFSIFPGIDRTLKILGGVGVRLDFAGRTPVTLTPASAPFEFPGDVATEAFLVDGPVDDLNIMVRRGRFAAQTRQARIEGDMPLAPRKGGVILVYLETGKIGALENTAKLMLEAGDTLLLEAPAILQAGPPATACIIEIWPA